MPMYERLIRVIVAIAMVGGPLGYLIGGTLSPAIHAPDQSSITAAAATNPTINSLHMLAFVLASYLLPIGAVGLAFLAYPRTPWAATIGGILAVIGWLPFSALTALDDLINVAAEQPSAAILGSLLHTFGGDPVMLGYLLVYIVCHLIAYVILGLALRRHVIPAWAGWAMVASSPLTVLAFALPSSPRVIGAIALTLLVAGSVPAAAAMLRTQRSS
ncbi:hypothetical protein AB0H43_13220 [Hamadaea sp. NPDC050747]|uniref:hypothetical protein n=1 Tax=Hamadaea sp. NPDC050747 TaxID=3155789 RepID=UPI0033D8620A